MKKLICAAALASVCALLPACQHSASDAAVGNLAFSGLDGSHWQLVEFRSMDDAQGITRPADPSKYTITFHNDGSLTAQLDCNRGAGPWQNDISNATGGTLSIGPLAVTKAFCPEPSMGGMIERNLGYVRSFTVEDDRLNMSLMADGGIIVWEAKPYP